MKLPQERKKTVDEKVSRQGGEKLFEAQSPAAEIDNALLDKLRKLRKEIAAREAVPAYIVFSDASLLDMCRKKPLSLVQFFGVNGVGQIKLEKYGETFTALIREHCE
jgi:superfamily II DNA helicase RecQ